MLHAARTSAPRAAAPSSTRPFLIDSSALRIARNSPENNALSFSKRSKIRCFGKRFALDSSLVTTQKSTIDSSHPYFRQFLIASRPALETELTPSQQTRKDFLIASFSAILSRESNPPIRRLAFPAMRGLRSAKHQSRSTRHSPLITRHCLIQTLVFVVFFEITRAEAAGRRFCAGTRECS